MFLLRSRYDADGAKNATFCAVYKKRASFCQDRLGTNIGKTQKRVAFFADAWVLCLRAHIDGGPTDQVRRGFQNRDTFVFCLFGKRSFAKTGSGKRKEKKTQQKHRRRCCFETACSVGLVRAGAGPRLGVRTGSVSCGGAGACEVHCQPSVRAQKRLFCMPLSKSH